MAAVGDVDGDGNVDFVTPLLGAAVEGLFVYPGRGDGTFAEGRQVAGTADLGAVAVADFDGDGRSDVVIGSRVLRQSAGGQLNLVQTLTERPAGRLRAADIDRDGRPDLVGMDASGVIVWRNDGGAGFGAALRYQLTSGGDAVSDIAVADIDGDGRSDLVVLLVLSGQHRLLVMPQRADGTFSALASTPVGSSSDAALAVGDIDGDGRPDAVVGGLYDVLVFRNAGGGAFAAPVRLAGSSAPVTGAEVADMDGDGRLDIVAVYADRRFTVHLQQADGTLAAPVSYASASTSRPKAIVVADVNRDGRPDVLAEGALMLRLPQPIGASAARPERSRSLQQRLLRGVR